MQNSWMKIIVGRIINMLAVLILLFGHVSAANASTFKYSKSDKSLKFHKINLVDDVNSFLEDEEEEEEEENCLLHYYIVPFENSIEYLEFEKKILYNQKFLDYKNEQNTTLPLWLEVRHIII